MAEEKDKRRNSELQNITQKTRIEMHIITPF